MVGSVARAVEAESVFEMKEEERAKRARLQVRDREVGLCNVWVAQPSRLRVQAACRRLKEHGARTPRELAGETPALHRVHLPRALNLSLTSNRAGTEQLVDLKRKSEPRGRGSQRPRRARSPSCV